MSIIIRLGSVRARLGDDTPPSTYGYLVDEAADVRRYKIGAKYRVTALRLDPVGVQVCAHETSLFDVEVNDDEAFVIRGVADALPWDEAQALSHTVPFSWVTPAL